MSLFSMLYRLIIGPLELLFDTIFSVAYRVLQNCGASIILLSIAMNFLVLPLYKRADAMQEEEKNTQEKMAGWVKHIKKTFKGDERFMMLQAYYRENNYKPSYALRGSLSLLLQIPFFMAAYNFLSNLKLLEQMPFGPVADLSRPDAMFTVFGFTVNVLPILMTVINIISGMIYTKGAPLKTKIQLYAMALFFLVFLYNSPSGLVLYWTLNNVFSLIKNIFGKLKNPRLVGRILLSAAGAAMLLLAFFHPSLHMVNRIYYAIGCGILMQLPLILYLRGNRGQTQQEISSNQRRNDRRIFLISCIFLTLLAGILIPSAVIKASPSEFINVTEQRHPLEFVLQTLLIAAGALMVWFGIFYSLFEDRQKHWFSLASWIIAGTAIVNYMFFGNHLGNLSSTLTYEVVPVFTGRAILINLAVLLAVAAVMFVIWKRFHEAAKIIGIVMCAAVLVMSGMNISSINGTVSTMALGSASAEENEPHIEFSRTGKNVFVLMLDRAISSYVPYIMNEKPELKDSFAGFTYYPNTISYGAYTNTGSPGLYGGYEYIPEENNKRTTERLVDKQNEADKVMPVLFDQNGYDVTVCDPTYAGYLYLPDISIYDDYPGIKKYITMGAIRYDGGLTTEELDKVRNHNFICYSIMKCAPMALQRSIYNLGAYNSSDTIRKEDEKQRTFAEQAFLDSYAVLRDLPELTKTTSNDKGAFVMMSNNTTHEIWQFLQEPEYVPSDHIDNTKYDLEHQDRFVLESGSLEMDDPLDLQYYQANMAALLNLGKWFDWLREAGLYDNTRIILVSDHGYFLGQRPEWRLGDAIHEDLMNYNAFLMVKDFNSNDPLRTSDEFMTNADVPTLAMEGMISNPVNPFTGKPITNEHKQGKQHILFSDGDGWNVEKANGNVFFPGIWYSVHDNIFDLSNWERIEDPGQTKTENAD